MVVPSLHVASPIRAEFGRIGMTDVGILDAILVKRLYNSRAVKTSNFERISFLPVSIFDRTVNF